MAQSKRLRGSRSPVVNYKVGDGSIRDLFRYIVGEDLVVKKIRPKRKQTTVNNKEDKVRVKETITSAVNTIFAAKERRYNQGGTKFSQPVPFGDPNSNIYGPQKSATARHNIRGSVEETARNPFGADVPPTAVEPITIRAEEGPIKVRPQRGYDTLAMQGENVVPRSGARRRSPVESYQRGDISQNFVPWTPEELEIEERELGILMDRRSGDTEREERWRREEIEAQKINGVDTVFGEGQVGFSRGGYVQPKKRKKKRLSKGGKVTSYNY